MSALVATAHEKFEIGLHATIREILKIMSALQGLLVPSPVEGWEDVLSPRSRTNPFCQRMKAAPSLRPCLRSDVETVAIHRSIAVARCATPFTVVV